jgi:hypothetical protein
MHLGWNPKFIELLVDKILNVFQGVGWTLFSIDGKDVMLLDHKLYRDFNESFRLS